MKTKITPEAREILIKFILEFEAFGVAIKEQNVVFTDETGKWWNRLLKTFNDAVDKVNKG